MIGKWAKALGVVVVTVLTFLMSVFTDGITPAEWVLTAGVALAAINAAIVPNLDTGIATVAKTIVTASLAGLGVLAPVIMDGLSGTDLIMALIAALAAIGVTAIPNAWPSATLRGTGVSGPPPPR